MSSGELGRLVGEAVSDDMFKMPATVEAAREIDLDAIEAFLSGGEFNPEPGGSTYLALVLLENRFQGHLSALQNMQDGETGTFTGFDEMIGDLRFVLRMKRVTNRREMSLAQLNFMAAQGQGDEAMADAHRAMAKAFDLRTSYNTQRLFVQEKVAQLRRLQRAARREQRFANGATA